MNNAAPRLKALWTQARCTSKPVVLLGIGNEFRGDDAIGHLIAQDLSSLEIQGLRAFPVGVSVENATHLVARHRAQVLLLIDAISEAERPLGAWDFFEPQRLDAFIHSTHSVPLSLFVAYWKREIPGLEIHFIGINIHGTEMFQGMSPAVEAARQEIVGLLLARCERGASS